MKSLAGLLGKKRRLCKRVGVKRGLTGLFHQMIDITDMTGPAAEKRRHRAGPLIRLQPRGQHSTTPGHVALMMQFTNTARIADATHAVPNLTNLVNIWLSGLVANSKHCFTHGPVYYGSMDLTCLSVRKAMLGVCSCET